MEFAFSLVSAFDIKAALTVEIDTSTNGFAGTSLETKSFSSFSCLMIVDLGAAVERNRYGSSRGVYRYAYQETSHLGTSHLSQSPIECRLGESALHEIFLT